MRVTEVRPCRACLSNSGDDVDCNHRWRFRPHGPRPRCGPFGPHAFRSATGIRPAPDLHPHRVDRLPDPDLAATLHGDQASGDVGSIRALSRGHSLKPVAWQIAGNGSLASTGAVRPHVRLDGWRSAWTRRSGTPRPPHAWQSALRPPLLHARMSRRRCPSRPWPRRARGAGGSELGKEPRDRLVAATGLRSLRTSPDRPSLRWRYPRLSATARPRP